MDRRKFLLSGAALGCSAAASPLLTPVALAAAPWENRLIVIILRGGMDGLDVVRPWGDPEFTTLRPRLAETEPAPDLDGFYGLHPEFEAVRPLWEAGELGFVHAVSTPYRDRRSHFDGQDILEAGIADLGQGLRDGWLNRLLQTVPGLEAETAYAIGRERMLVLAGDAPAASWAPASRLRISEQAERLLELVHHDDPLFRQASADAIAIAREIEADAEMSEETGTMMAENTMMQEVPRGANVALAEFAASRLRGDTRIAAFSINGWDTHNNQQLAMPRRLGALSNTLISLKAGLGEVVWGKTAVICLTEFGRTARENGSGGTDHGTGGAVVLAGGALRGRRVIGDWPGLSEADLYDRRDLTSTRDVRAHAGWLMRGLFGLETGLIERAVFPGLELGADPGLLL